MRRTLLSSAGYGSGLLFCIHSDGMIVNSLPIVIHSTDGFASEVVNILRLGSMAEKSSSSSRAEVALVMEPVVSKKRPLHEVKIPGSTDNRPPTEAEHVVYIGERRRLVLQVIEDAFVRFDHPLT
jgi:hypothetical protein